MSKFRIAFLIWLSLMVTVATTWAVATKLHPKWVCNDCGK